MIQRSGTFSGCVWLCTRTSTVARLIWLIHHCLPGTTLIHHSIHLFSIVLGAKNRAVSKTNFPASWSLYSKGKDRQTTKRASPGVCSGMYAATAGWRGSWERLFLQVFCEGDVRVDVKVKGEQHRPWMDSGFCSNKPPRPPLPRMLPTFTRSNPTVTFTPRPTRAPGSV